MLQPLSLEITQEIIQACFGQANILPTTSSDIFGQEWGAWSVFMGVLGIGCNKAIAQSNENLKDLLENVRSFFIDDDGQIKQNRTMSLSLSPSKFEGLVSWDGFHAKWEKAQEVHVSAWKKAPRPF